MKKLAKRSLALLMSAVMTTGVFLVSMPKKETSVNADSSIKDVMYGEEMLSYLKSVSNKDNSPIIWFGSDGMNGGSGRWNVVGFDGTGVARDVNSGGMTILNQHAVMTGEYYYGGNVNGYVSSDLFWILDTVYSASNVERTALVQQSFSDDSGTDTARYWALSMREASGLALGLRNVTRPKGQEVIGSAWWTRSMVNGKQEAFVMYEGELVEMTTHNNKVGCRAAGIIDLSKIAFIKAPDAKDKYRESGFKSIEEYSGEEWVMTVFDQSYTTFSASLSKTELEPGGEVGITYSGGYPVENCGVSAILCDKDGNMLRYGSVDTTSSSGEVTMTLPSDLEDGDYVLKVFAESVEKTHNTSRCTNIVNIDIKVKEVIPPPGPVSNPQAEMAGKNKVTITWDEYEGVEGYLIYSEKAGKFGYVGMVKKGNPTTYTDTKALDTEINKYWIAAYVVDKSGKVIIRDIDPQEKPDAQSKGGCPAVTGLKATAQTGKVKLTWNASIDAEGYLVYGIRDNTAYTYIGMTTQGTTFTDTKASKTGWNFYWVFPYYKDGDKMIVGGTAKYVYGKAR